MKIQSAPIQTTPRRVVFMEEVEERKHVVMLEGGERRYLTEGDDWHLYPDITEQGDRVTFISGPDDQHLAVSVLDLASGKETFLTGWEGRHLHPTFSGDGSKVAFSQATGEKTRRIALIDTPPGLAFEPPSKPKTQVVPGSEGGYFPSLSHDGSLVLYQRERDGVREIVGYDFKVGKESVLAEGMAPSLSPDGAAFAYTKKVDGDWNIHVRDIASGTEHQVTHDPNLDFAPSFAPDGSLYFASDRAGSFDIYRLTSEQVERGEDVPEVIAQGPESFYAPDAGGAFTAPA